MENVESLSKDGSAVGDTDDALVKGSRDSTTLVDEGFTQITPDLSTVVTPTTKPSHLPGTKLHSTAQAIALISLVTSSMAMQAGGSTSLNIALPTIQKELNISEVDLQWLVSGFTLTSACFLLLAGRVADIYGRKLCFMLGMGWFSVFTLIAGFVQSGVGLIIVRALSGIGIAVGIPSSIGIIAVSFEGQWRSTAFAMFSAGAPVGGGTGMVLGGFVTAYSGPSWRTAMYIFAALAAFILVVAFFVVPTDGPRPKDKRIDWVGAALVTGGLILLQFVISQSNTAPRGWGTTYIIVLLIVSLLLLAAFFVWEHLLVKRSSLPPLMRLALWTRAHGKLATMYFVGFAAWMGFQSAGFHLALLFQQVMLTGVIGAVVRTLPAPVCGILCNVLIAKIVARVPTQWIVCTGLAATGTASVFFAVSGPNNLYWTFPFNGVWLNVVGADFIMSTSTIFVAAMALPQEQSVAGALFQTLVQLGGSLGLALTSTLAQSEQSKATRSGASTVDAIGTGLSAAFFLGAAFCYAALILSAVMLRGLGIVAKPPPPSSSPNEAKDEEVSDEEAKKEDIESKPHVKDGDLDSRTA